MTVIVERDSSMARAMPRVSPPTRVTSDASIATSAPVPIATPRSARASAGASFRPSPTIATVRPLARRRSIRSVLSAEPDVGQDPVRRDAHGPTHRLRRRAAVAGRQPGLDPLSVRAPPRRPEPSALTGSVIVTMPAGPTIDDATNAIVSTVRRCGPATSSKRSEVHAAFA